MLKRYKQLTSEQRYVIYLGLQKGASKKDIASSIGVHPSTLYRELQRNKSNRGGYSRQPAHEMAQERKERLPGNRSTPEWIKQKALRLIREDWSPKQVCRMLLPFKDQLKTITTDNGSEFADHELITERLGVSVYFADPYCSWQKETIENGNKLIRQYIPKGLTFKNFF